MFLQVMVEVVPLGGCFYVGEGDYISLFILVILMMDYGYQFQIEIIFFKNLMV